MAENKTPKTRKPRTTVPKDETKEQRSVRLGQARMTKTINSIGLLANLAGANYSFTEEQIGSMCNALIEATNSVVAALTRPRKGAKNDTGFRF